MSAIRMRGNGSLHDTLRQPAKSRASPCCYNTDNNRSLLGAAALVVGSMSMCGMSIQKSDMTDWIEEGGGWIGLGYNLGKSSFQKCYCDGEA